MNADIFWLPDDEPILVADAADTLEDILIAAGDRASDWIVISRHDGIFLYAYRSIELETFLHRHRDLASKPVEEALGLREDMISETAPADQRPVEIDVSTADLFQPSMTRVIAVDASRTPVAIGQIVGHPGAPTEMFREFEMDEAMAEPPDFDLGPVRGHGAAPPANVAPPATNGDQDTVEQRIDVILSAQCPDQIALNAEAVLLLRLERESGAAPLPAALPTAQISEREDVEAVLTVDPVMLDVIGPSRRHLAPPGENAPRTDFFLLRGKSEGSTRVSVAYFQGSSELGSLFFDVRVVGQVDNVQPARHSSAAMPRDTADDEALVLVIRESIAGTQRRLNYLVSNGTLDWHFMEFESRPLDDSSDASNSTLRFVRTIYNRLVERVLERRSDLNTLQFELQGIGADLSSRLFPDDFVRKIWDHRHRITVVHATSFEPHIPWELVRLRHPDSNEIDDRYLAEYGLVRSFSGVSGQRDLRASEWRFVVGEYPNHPEWALGEEVDTLERELPARGVRTARIASDPVAIYQALGTPDFDVLYVACHGDTDLDNIEMTTLAVGDRVLHSGDVTAVTIDPTTVGGVANLRTRRPIIFLNACESAQQTTSLTDWGGWPSTFWKAGAGAFVGTSWSVRERPAISFAMAFNEALFEGDTLSQAATRARAAAKASGDSSWLAYVVYGHPFARLSGNDDGR